MRVWTFFAAYSAASNVENPVQSIPALPDYLAAIADDLASPDAQVAGACEATDGTVVRVSLRADVVGAQDAGSHGGEDEVVVCVPKACAYGRADGGHGQGLLWVDRRGACAAWRRFVLEKLLLPEPMRELQTASNAPEDSSFAAAEPTSSSSLFGKHVESAEGHGDIIGFADLPAGVSCVNTGWTFPGPGPVEVTAWKIRFRRSAREPRSSSFRLQVWRPIRVGWQRGQTSFRLVGEHRLRLRASTHRLRSVDTPVDSRVVWHYVVANSARRIVARPGDVLGWASAFSPRSHNLARGRREVARRLRRRPGRVDTTKPHATGLLCTKARPQVECGWWPRRLLCGFTEVWRGAPLEAEAEFISQISTVAEEDLGTNVKTDLLVSVAYELHWRHGAFAVWLAEFLAGIFKDELPLMRLAIFVCPPADAVEQEVLNTAVREWQTLRSMYGITLGISMRCAERHGLSVDTKGAADFLLAVNEGGVWPVWADSQPHAREAATEVAAQNPSGLGVVLVHITEQDVNDVYPCVALLPAHAGAGSDGGECLGVDGVVPTLVLPVQKDISLRPSAEIGELLRLRRNMNHRQCLATESDVATGCQGTPFIAILISCVNCLDLADNTDSEPSVALSAIITQSVEVTKLLHRSHSVKDADASIGTPGSRAVRVARLFGIGDAVRSARLFAALDVRDRVDAKTTYEEFMTLRQGLSSLDLRMFEDKVQLRLKLQSLGVAHTPVYYMSSTSPSVVEHIVGRSNYVVKPSHMTEGEYVFAVYHGTYLYQVRVDEELTLVKGAPADPAFIQQRVLDAWNKTAYEWECAAVKQSNPGVIVERLVLATMDLGAPDVERVEEVRCHTVWGRVVAVEISIGKVGSILLTVVTDRVGRQSMTSEMIWSDGLWGAEYVQDHDGWIHLMRKVCLPKAFVAAERVASGFRADHLRVDFLIEGTCDQIYVSELELFPAAPFPPSTLETMEKLWRYGYGYDGF